MLLQVVDVDKSGEVDEDEFIAFWDNAPPFKYGDMEQKEYWAPRRCTDAIYEEMLHFYDIRMSYMNSEYLPLTQEADCAGSVEPTLDATSQIDSEDDAGFEHAAS